MKNIILNYRLICVAVICSLMFSTPLFCQTTAELNLEADRLWKERGDFYNAEHAMNLYEAIAKKDPKDIDTRIKVAEAAFWLFKQLPVENKIMKKKEIIDIISRGIVACEEIIQLAPQHPGAWYWMIFLNSAKNYYESLLDWNFFLAIRGTIYVANGDLNYNFGGIYRYWAEIMLHIPGIIGRVLDFSPDKMIWLTNESLKIEPDYLATKMMLGQCYLKNKDKKKARELFEEVLAADPEALKGYGPENRLIQRQVRELLDKL